VPELNDEQLSLTTAGFAELKLGLPLYKWQAKGLLPLEWATGPNVGPGENRQNIAIVTPNGSGKDERIIPSAVYWFLYYHPRGRVVITSKSDTQLSTQTIPNLDKHWRKFGWNPPVQSPRYTLLTPTGGSLIAYVTNEGARAEGHHSRPGEPLMMIVNEAKSIDASIWEGIDRCTPDVLLLVSSPGLREGRFYDCFGSKMSSIYHTVRAGLSDCPHINRAKIESVKAIYGEDHPITRSTLYGEFMTQDGTDQYCLTIEELEPCLDSPPTWKPGFKYGFFDFADGRAENVFVVRNGNKFEIADAWRDTNEDAVVGRSIYLIRKHNLQPNQVGGDAAAKSILDKMAASGFAINRQNFGRKERGSLYTSWSARAWLEGCSRIRSREVIIPDDAVLKAQITKRKKRFTVDGKLGVEDKVKMMNERGLESPDRADALFGCMAKEDTSLDVQTNDFTFLINSDHEKTVADELAQSVGL
jgi:hypothetical protein